MPTYRHPSAEDDTRGPPPARVHVGHREPNVPVAEDGTFDAPEAVGAAIAERFDRNEADIRVEPQGSASESGGESEPETDEPEECGDVAASTSDDCGRPPGWGRDADDGPCTDHLP